MKEDSLQSHNPMCKLTFDELLQLIEKELASEQIKGTDAFQCLDFSQIIASVNRAQVMLELRDKMRQLLSEITNLELLSRRNILQKDDSSEQLVLETHDGNCEKDVPDNLNIESHALDSFTENCMVLANDMESKRSDQDFATVSPLEGHLPENSILERIEAVVNVNPEANHSDASVANSVQLEPNNVKTSCSNPTEINVPAREQVLINESHRQSFFTGAKSLQNIADENMTGKELAYLKYLYCLGKVILSFSESSHIQVVKDELSTLKVLHNRIWKESAFFGFGSTSRAPDVWMKLSIAYDLLTVAVSGLEGVGENFRIKTETDRRFILGIAACETYLHRILEENVPNVIDKQQKEINSRLRDLNDGGASIPYWAAPQSGGFSTEKIFKDALSLRGVVDDWLKNSKKAEKVQINLNALFELLNSNPSNVEEFYDNLIKCTIDCLVAGVKPNNKTFVKLLEPYYRLLEDVTNNSVMHSSLKPVVAELRKQATLMTMKNQISVEKDIPLDSELEKMTEELKVKLAGKVMLLIGGNKGQQHRIKNLKEGLGLRDLEWPDLEAKRKPSEVTHLIEKSDIACLLIRWSRHSYKQLLDQAREQGKVTAILPHGIGLNTVVRDLHGQICNMDSSSAKHLKG